MLIFESLGGLLAGVFCSSNSLQNKVSAIQREIAHQISDRFPKNHDAPRAVIEAAALALEKLLRSEATTYDVSSSLEDLRALQIFSRKLRDWTADWRRASNEALESAEVNAMIDAIAATLITNAHGDVSETHLGESRDEAIQAMRKILIEATDPPKRFLDRFDGNAEGRSFFQAFAEYIAVALKTNHNFRVIFEETQLAKLESGIVELLGFERRRSNADFKDAGIEWIDDILRPSGVSKNRPTAMVLARHRLIPFLDHADRLSNIEKWARKQEYHSYDAARSVLGRLYVGDGGVGKTRLALEFAEKLDNLGWEVARISSNAETNRIWRSFDAPNKPKGILIILDYVEAKQDVLKSIAREGAKRSRSSGPPIRILALARSAHDWWDDIFSSEGMEIFERQPISFDRTVSPLSLHHRRIIYDAATSVFSIALESLALQRGEHQILDLSKPEFDRPVSIAFAAYLAMRGVQVTGEVDLVSEMLSEEKKAWARYIKSQANADDSIMLSAIERGAAQLTFLQGASKELAKTVLCCDSFFGIRAPADITEIINTLRAFYPGDAVFSNAVGKMEPDMLGEAFVARAFSSITSDGLIVDTMLSLSRTKELSQKCPDILQMLIRGAGQHPEESTRSAFIAMISELSKAIEADLFEEEAVLGIADCLPNKSTALLEFAIAVENKALDYITSNKQLARHLNNLGIRYAYLGDLEAARDTVQRSVTLHRDLVSEFPDGAKHKLAGSLNNLGIIYSDLGDLEAAVEATKEAVEICRDLAVSNPDTVDTRLPDSLSSLGALQSSLGELDAAIETTKEAVDINRRMADHKPEDFSSDLASSLANLGSRYSELGDYRAAVDAVEEAVGLFRHLAKNKPDAFNPDLAITLTILGNCYCELEDTNTAMDVAEEATRLIRPLLEIYPDRFSNTWKHIQDLSSRAGNRS